jgi:hypothetical protein
MELVEPLLVFVSINGGFGCGEGMDGVGGGSGSGWRRILLGEEEEERMGRSQCVERGGGVRD